MKVETNRSKGSVAVVSTYQQGSLFDPVDDRQRFDRPVRATCGPETYAPDAAQGGPRFTTHVSGAVLPGVRSKRRYNLK
jgi:hypothetical protein